MYKQLCKMSIPETKRSLHNMTSKLKKIMKMLYFVILLILGQFGRVPTSST